MRSRSHKEGGTTKIFPYRNSVRPQDQKEKPKPLCRITASCFPEHLSKIPMGSLYLPICLGIIRRYSNSFNPILLLQPSHRSSIHTRIVRNNISNTSPTTYYILKQPYSH